LPTTFVSGSLRSVESDKHWAGVRALLTSDASIQQPHPDRQRPDPVQKANSVAGVPTCSNFQRTHRPNEFEGITKGDQAPRSGLRLRACPDDRCCYNVLRPPTLGRSALHPGQHSCAPTLYFPSTFNANPIYPPSMLHNMLFHDQPTRNDV
jgi:hypothetical protein